MDALKETLQVLNNLESQGILESYAVAGALGAFFYIEPTATEDLDVFIAIGGKEQIIITLEPIYEALAEMGFSNFDQEGIRIGDWPVQFLLPGSSLVNEALEQAAETEFDGTPTRIFTAEHLAAICLDTGRPKDHMRLSQFLEEKCIDEEKFHTIIKTHFLEDKWQSFCKRNDITINSNQQQRKRSGR